VTPSRIPRLLALIDRPACRAHGVDPRDACLRALTLTGTHALLRWPDAPADAFERWADEVVTELARRLDPAARHRVLAAHHPRVAADLGLGGATLRDDDASAAEARALLGPKALLGRSLHAVPRRGERDDAPIDFWMLAPICAPQSKPHDTRPPLGLQALHAPWTRPVLALGGIDDANAEQVLRAGAYGVAALTPFCVPDPGPGRALHAAVVAGTNALPPARDRR
jgi:thiamine monophosphate synthase